MDRCCLVDPTGLSLFEFELELETKETSQAHYLDHVVDYVFTAEPAEDADDDYAALAVMTLVWIHQMFYSIVAHADSEFIISVSNLTSNLLHADATSGCRTSC